MDAPVGALPKPSELRHPSTSLHAVDEHEDHGHAGNIYDAALCNIAGGPVSTGRLIVAWLVLVTAGYGLFWHAGIRTERELIPVLGAFSVLYFFGLVPAWVWLFHRR